MEQAELIERQIEREEEMRGEGIARYLKNTANNPEAELPPGMRMLKHTVGKMSEAVTAWIADVRAGKARKYSHVANALQLCGVDAVAYLTMRHAINAVSGKVKVTSFAISLGTAISDEIEFAQFKAAHPDTFKRVAKKVEESSNSEYRTKVLHLIRRREGVQDLGWDKAGKLQIGTLLMELAIKSTGIVELVTLTEGHHNKAHHLVGTEKTRKWMSNQHEYCQAMLPLYMPMLCKPNDWISPFSGGYMTHRMDMIKTPNKNYLEELENLEMPMVYTALNALQGTAWRINRKVLEVLKDVWNIGDARAKLPNKDPLPVPNKPFDIDDNEESLKEWKKKAASIHTKNNRNLSKVSGVGQKIYLAEKYLEETEFFYVWTLDWRGRAYPVGTILHPQSDDSGKALIEFAHGKPLGALGWKWLAVQLANTWGEDKCSYQDRIKWATDNEALIIEYASDPLGNQGWMDADSPFCFLATCFEWAGYKKSGDAHICHLQIQVDGSCNGLQNFSGLLLDSEGGAATNLIPSEIPSDIYGIVAKRASEVMAKDAAAGKPEAKVLLGKYGRNWTKKNTMTYAYSVSQYGMTDQVMTDLRKFIEEGGALDLTDTDMFKTAAYLSSINRHAIETTVVAAKEAMDWLKEVARLAASDGLPVWWTSPSGLVIQQSYMDTLGQRVRCMCGGKRTEFIIQVEGTKINGRKQSAGIAPNYIHANDGAHLARTIGFGVAKGITDFSFIHDSYGTHACDMDLMSTLLRESFIEQYTPNLLEKFRTEIVTQLVNSGSQEIADQIPPIPAMGTLNLEDVRNSRYFFA